MADAATEKIAILLEAKYRDFERQLERQNRGIARFAARADRDMARTSRSVETSMGRMGAAIGRFGTGALAALVSGAVIGQVRSAVGALADLADTADRIGIGTEDFQGLQRGFKLAGVEAAALSTNLEVFTQRLGEAKLGQGELTGALRRQGIALNDSQGQIRPTLDLLRDYADAVAALPSEAERMAAATDAFGRGGRDMALAMREGAAGIDAMMDSAQAGGFVQTDALARRAQELDDKFDDLTLRIGNMFKGLSVGAAELAFGLADGIGGALDDIAAKIEALPDLPVLAEPDFAGASAGIEAEQLEVLRLETDLIDANREAIARLASENRALAAAARVVQGDLAEMAGSMVEIGDYDLANKLSDLSMEISLLNKEFDDGVTVGGEFADKMGIVVDQVGELIGQAEGAQAELSAIDLVTMSGITSSIGALIGTLGTAITAARALRAALPGGSLAAIPAGVNFGTPATEDGHFLDSPANEARMRGVELTMGQPPVIPPTRPTDIDFGYFGPGDGGGGDGGGGAAQTAAYADAVAQLREELSRLELESVEITAVADSGYAMGDALEYARKRAELLYAAQQDGLTITPELRAEIDQLAMSLTEAGRNAEDAADKLQQMESNAAAGADALTDIFLGVMDGSRSAKDAVLELLAEIAKVNLRRSLLNMGGGGGGGFLGWLGGLLSPRAGGGTVMAGSPYQVGERGAEMFVPEVNGRILSVAQSQRAGGGAVEVRVVGGDLALTDSGQVMARVRVVASQAGQAAVRTVQQTLPGMMSQYQRDGRIA